MYRTVLIPLDGSIFAEHALPYAAKLARHAGAALQVVHVHAPAVVGLYSGSELIADVTLDARIRESEMAYLDGVVQRLTENVPGRVSRTLTDGLVADALHEQAQAVAADLVVMATHGRGVISRFWLGSVADTLVRRLPMPILLIRPQEQAPNLAADVPLRRILIPLDGSDFAEQILEPAITLGSLTNAEYSLLRVVELPTGPPHPVSGQQSELSGRQSERLVREAQEYLDGVAERLWEQSLRVETRVAINQSPAAAILEAARRDAAALIALQAHGRGGLARLLLGSVADKVIRGALTPVLVHRPVAKNKGGVP